MTEKLHSEILHGKCIVEAIRAGVPFSYVPFRRSYNC
jgi:hypothetical protein